MITTYVLEEINSRRPLTIAERCDRLLAFLGTRLVRLNDGFRTAGNMDDEVKRNRAELCAHAELATDREINRILQFLVRKDWISLDNGANISLTYDGIQRLEELRHSRANSIQAFVAMWFDKSMQDAYEQGIVPAVTDAGYRCFRVDQKEHIGKIDDEIIAEIRRSRFVVADFTSEVGKARGGVYFEAGFASGLNIPVIWTCREDCLGSVHFDTRQFNHITWSAPTELRTKLYNRIGAVIGDGPLKKGN